MRTEAMLTIRPSRPDDAPRNLEIWREAVDATHDFLGVADRAEIDAMVSEHLPAMAPWVAIDEADRALGFMAMTDAHIDALFVDPQVHGRGVGRGLVDHARSIHPVLTLDVNEQNPGAIAFYEKLGFARTGRSPTDDQGRPYPLIHMRSPG